MTSVTLPAYAKVNLYLDILSKRPDGYHELVTLFERVDLADEVTLEMLPQEKVELICGHPEVPSDGTNLVMQAVDLYRNSARWFPGIRITLAKQIPVGGGMGGGSSDAAAALEGLQILSGEALSEGDLLGIAKELGADVPFFLCPSSWAVGRGRGDELEPLGLTTRLWHLLVAPRFAIPTKEIYQAFHPPAHSGRSLTAPGGNVTLLLAALRDNDVHRIGDFLFNVLEPTVEALYPAIRHVKATIQESGGLPRSLVSGSGSTVLAVCASRAQAQAAAEALKKACPEWQVAVAATQM